MIENQPGTLTTVEVEEAPHVWKLSHAEFAATQEKIAKINDRAAKRGLTGRYELVGVETTEEQVNSFTGLTDTWTYIATTLTGERPKYDNTAFLARVEWNEGQPIVQAAPGVEGVDRSVLVDGHCSHCNKIRSRKFTYVVERDGVQAQIGGTCIKDYLGWSANPVRLWADDPSDEFEGSFGGRAFGPSGSWTPLTILQTAWATIRCYGFVPVSGGGFGGGLPTSNLVKFALGYWDLPQHRVERGGCYHCELVAKLEKIGAFVEDAAAEAQRVLDFVLSDDFGGASEYVQNLKTLAAASSVEGKFIGLLASAPQAYAKHQEKTLVRKAREERPSDHVGAVKERLTLTVTIEAIRYIERYNQFNHQDEVTVLYTLRDPETGNVFKWFASREALGEEKGRTVTVKGTVKAHETYNNLKSTVLTRVAEQA
jgi:hypothetical protein